MSVGVGELRSGDLAARACATAALRGTNLHRVGGSSRSGKQEPARGDAFGHDQPRDSSELDRGGEPRRRRAERCSTALEAVRLLTAGAILSATACSDRPAQGEDQAESAGMRSDDKPWWHEMREEQKARAREEVARLLEISPGYPRPPADPAIYQTNREDRIVLVDRATGDYVEPNESDREGLLADFVFRTKNGAFVVAFKTQTSGGFTMDWDRLPIRVYSIVEARQQTDEVREARKRISLGRLAQFMAALHEFAENPDIDFVIIDAPLPHGERL